MRLCLCVLSVNVYEVNAGGGVGGPPFTLLILVYLHSRVGYQRPGGVTSVCVCMCVNRQPGGKAVRTQWTTTKELISNQLPTCFCPAPFIWLECRAGFHSTHTHTPPAAYACVRMQPVCMHFLVNLDYCRDVW